jgi:hypothetical protein
MTPDDKDLHEDDLLRDLFEATEAIDGDPSPTNLDEISAAYSRKLCQKRLPVFEPKAIENDPISAQIRTLSGRPDTIDARIALLRKTTAFEERELRDIRRTRLFFVARDGGISLRHQRFSDAEAKRLLIILCAIGGVWFGRIAFGNLPGMLELAGLLAYGCVLGALAHRILLLSFRFIELREKVLRIAPWMGAPSS